MNMKQSCKALISAIEGELDGRHCTEEQAAAILDHALPSLTEALALAESERDRYKAAWMEFMDRTDWMQEKGQVPAKYLGQHRADVLTKMLTEARAALATQPAAYVLTKDDEIYWEGDDGIVISNTPGDCLDESYEWRPVGFISQPASGEPAACRHRLADARNKHIASGYLCVDCGTAFAAADHAAPPAAAHGDEAVAFANELISGAWEGGDFCGADIQELAVKHGLLRVERREESCQEEGCACAQYGFPTECYRKTAALAAMRAQAGEGGEV